MSIHSCTKWFITLLQKGFLGAGKNIFLGAMSLLLAAKNQLLTSLQIGVLTTYLMPRTYPLLHHTTQPLVTRYTIHLY